MRQKGAEMVSESAFFKFYEKKACRIFLALLIKSHWHKRLKLTAMSFLEKNYTGNAIKDVPNITFQLADGNWNHSYFATAKNKCCWLTIILTSSTKEVNDDFKRITHLAEDR